MVRPTTLRLSRLRMPRLRHCDERVTARRFCRVLRKRSSGCAFELRNSRCTRQLDRQRWLSWWASPFKGLGTPVLCCIRRGLGSPKSPRTFLWFVGGAVLKDRRYPRQPGCGWRVSVCFGGWRCPFCFCCVWWLRVLAAVGWFLWWLSCLFGVESGEGFVVFRHCGYRCTPGWDEADSGVESVHVAAAGRP